MNPRSAPPGRGGGARLMPLPRAILCLAFALGAVTHLAPGPNHGT